MEDLDLVDSIYESAFIPEKWPGVLDRLATIADAHGGCFATGNGRTYSTWTASSVLQPGMERLFETDLLNRSQRQERVLATGHSGFVRDCDIYTAGELDRNPLYRDFLRPAGLGNAAGTAFRMPTGDIFIISVERALSKGPVDKTAIAQLNAFRPRIGRAAFLSARQSLTRARAASDTLAMIGLPAIVMHESGKVLAANDLIENYKDHLVWRAADRFAFNDRDANALLQKAVETIEFAGAVRSFVVRSVDQGAAMVAHVLPLRGSARDIFLRCAAVLVLTPLTMPDAPPIELVQSLFDLTPAEARVARSIAAGETILEIAHGGGVSQHTVRTQMRGVLGKTGCRRQAEVAALLSGINVRRDERPPS